MHRLKVHPLRCDYNFGFVSGKKKVHKDIWPCFAAPARRQVAIYVNTISEFHARDACQLRAKTAIFDGTNLLTRLLLIVSVALVPALLFQIYSEYQSTRVRQELVAGEALRLAQLVSSEQQRIVEGAQEVLTTLVNARSVRALDPARCNAHMTALTQQLPRYVRAAVVDLNGHLLCASGPMNPDVDVSDRPYFRLALSSGGFAIGEYAIGRTSGKPGFHMAMPFRDKDGIVAGVVYVALGLDWLGEQLKQLSLPPGSAVSVSDRNGIVLARHPDGTRYVGTRLPAANLSTMRYPETVIAEAVGLDGVTRLTGYAPFGDGSDGLRIAVGLDRQTVFVAVMQPSRTGLVLIVAGFGLALAITGLLGGRAIRRPVARLLQITNLWRNGDLTARTGLHKDQSEFGRLAIAFDAMAEAQEARDRALRTALESTTDGVIVLDRAWRFTYVNKRAEQTIAHGHDLVGEVVWDGCPWLDDSAVGPALRQAMQSGEPAHVEDYFAPADVHFDAHAYPSKDGLTVFFHDTTEERRTAAALAKSETQLAAARSRAAHAERLEALGQLAGGIAHDFNNVLQVVKGVATLIKRRPGDEANVTRLAQRAMEAAERGGSITHRLLAFGRRGDLRAETLDMQAVLHGLQEILVHTLGAGVDVHIELAPDLPPAFADVAQLETVLVNLATNARDAMPQGGRLTIAAAPDDVLADNATHPADLTPGRYVRLSVTDTGIGMDADTLRRSQEPFFTTKKSGVGTGLGLPMAGGFAEQSGGALSIESSPGQGTTVMLWLPVDDPNSATRTAERPRAGRLPTLGVSMATAPARLLLVEDEDLLRDVLEQNLVDRGYAVAVAASGAEALALLENGEPFDAIVTDQSMPGMDGIALIRAAQQRRPTLPAVLLTGYAGEESTLLAGAPITGACSLARKPIATDDLVDRIEALLAARPSQVAQPEDAGA